VNEHFDPKRFSEEQDTFPPGGAISFGMQYITDTMTWNEHLAEFPLSSVKVYLTE